tara:strand:- start:65 stop:259 length:195 start_codon:yes stop_codon:yes gene_type:complete
MPELLDPPLDEPTPDRELVERELLPLVGRELLPLVGRELLDDLEDELDDLALDDFDGALATEVL